ncbi:hypothetical protein [Xanthobacter autotrophicus]|uniref:hypothetical protein n=1 Tax=Xanthobacter autotrophicus TaxID=280 RepID=UPI00372C53DC
MTLTFSAYERNHKQRLIEGLEWAKFQPQLFRAPVLRVRQQVQHDHLAGLALAANSHQGRLRWERAFLHHVADALGDRLDGTGHKTAARLLTLIDAREAYNRPHDRPEVKHLRHHFGKALWGLNFIGMLEPALYVSLRGQVSPTRRLFLWHVHAIAWRNSNDSIDHARAVARQHGFSTLLPGAPALMTKTITPGDLVRVSGYLNKSPRHQYSLAYKGEGAKPEHRRRSATGANLARLHRHLDGLYLDDLAIAGGEGKAVLNAIKADALSHWRRHKAQPPASRGLWFERGAGYAR